MRELTIDQELRLIELEVKRLEFLYKSYVDFSSYGTESPYAYSPNDDPRQTYIGVAHAETSKMLEAFKKKWDIS